MGEPIVHYEPPAEHDDHLRKMAKWLTVFFGSLFLIGLIFFFFAHHIVAFLPFQVEKKFVKPYEEMASRWLGDSLGDSEVEAYLTELVDELAAAMKLPENIDLSVHYLDMEERNAFATLGGHIVILRGLVESLPDENSLAMILSHEISHIKNRDPAASLGRGVVLQIAINHFSGGSQHAENLSSLGGQLGLLSYSRAQEERSDKEAIDALYRYYGHVGGHQTFFELMRNDENDAEDTPDWLQTHPDLDERVRANLSFVSENGYPVGKVKPYPRHILEKIGSNP